MTRAYAARAIVASRPDALAEAYPLLADRPSVTVVEGCVPQTRSVPAVVLRSVCDDLPESPARTSFLAKAAGDAALALSVRGAARTCSWWKLLAPRERDAEEGTRARQVEYPKPMEWIEEVAATHPYGRLRFYAATLCSSPFSTSGPGPRETAVLRRLACDRHPRVRACARALPREAEPCRRSESACRWPRRPDE